MNVKHKRHIFNFLTKKKIDKKLLSRRKWAIARITYAGDKAGFPKSGHICRLQYSSLCKINGVLTLGNVPGSGDFDMPLSNRLCFSTTYAWGSGDVVDRHFTHRFLYYYRIFKRWNIYY